MSAQSVIFVTHPDVVIDPVIPVTQWKLSPRGRARMRGALAQPWIRDIRAIHASTEQKAIGAAEILAAHLTLEFTTMAALGENDRSSTGYLPRAEFEATADAFFASPDLSIRGWERAVDAQRRIVAAVDAVLAMRPPRGDIAVISHGAVGALLICALEDVPISRAHDQPPGNGGHYFSFDQQTRLLRHGWLPIDG